MRRQKQLHLQRLPDWNIPLKNQQTAAYSQVETIHHWPSNKCINLLFVNGYKNPKLYTSIFCRKPSYNWHFKRPVNSVLQFQVNTQRILSLFFGWSVSGKIPLFEWIRVKLEIPELSKLNLSILCVRDPWSPKRRTTAFLGACVSYCRFCLKFHWCMMAAGSVSRLFQHTTFVRDKRAKCTRGGWWRWRVSTQEMRFSSAL